MARGRAGQMQNRIWDNRVRLGEAARIIWRIDDWPRGPLLRLIHWAAGRLEAVRRGYVVIATSWSVRALLGLDGRLRRCW